TYVNEFKNKDCFQCYFGLSFFHHHFLGGFGFGFRRFHHFGLHTNFLSSSIQRFHGFFFGHI
ncbi:MAG: hypothetical protein WBZ36_16250, partial [Candidatus Nitrosopolaris sp.]